MVPMFSITAISKKTMAREELFVWFGSEERGLWMALKEAKRFGRFSELTDYKAEVCYG